MDDDIDLALEVKAPWSDLLLDGTKTIECRAWPLPAVAAGARVWIVETTGPDGVPALGDAVEPGDGRGRVVGWAVFTGCREYRSAAEFGADAAAHRVPPGGAYGWREGEARRLYGWEVGGAARLPAPAPLPAMARVQRSLYRLTRGEG